MDIKNKKSDRKSSPLNPNSPPMPTSPIAKTSTPPNSSPLRKMMTVEPRTVTPRETPRVTTETPRMPIESSRLTTETPRRELESPVWMSFPQDWDVDPVIPIRMDETRGKINLDLSEKRLRTLSRSGSVNSPDSPVVRPIPIPHPLPLRRLSRSTVRSASLNSPISFSAASGSITPPSSLEDSFKSPPSSPVQTRVQKASPKANSPGRRRSLTISQPLTPRRDADTVAISRARTSSNLTIPSPLGYAHDDSSDDDRGRKRWSDPTPLFPSRLLALSTSLPRIRTRRDGLKHYNSFSTSPATPSGQTPQTFISHTPQASISHTPISHSPLAKRYHTEALPIMTRTDTLTIPILSRHDSASQTERLKRRRKPSYVPHSATREVRDDYVQAILEESRTAKKFRWKGDFDNVDFVDWQTESKVGQTVPMLRDFSSRSASPAFWDEDAFAGLTQPATDDKPPGMMRSLSDGDLTDFLKTFSELKSSLKVAKESCDVQVEKIIGGLQEHVEREMRKREDIQQEEESDIINPIEYGRQRMTSEGRRRSGGAATLFPMTTLGTPSPPRRHTRHRSTSSLRPPSRTEGSEAIQTPFEAALGELISMAQTALEMDAAMCMLEPTRVQDLLSRIQKLQAKWDANPSWPCREYLIRLLLVFGGVGRIVEHLLQDERTWNVTKPNDETRQPTLLIEADPIISFVSQMPKPTTNSRSDRTNKPQTDWSLTELREATEEAKNLTVLLEMDVDDCHVNYISPSCKQVFGYDSHDIFGETQPPFMDKEAQAVFSQSIRSLRLAGDRISMEILYKAFRKDGRILDMVARGVLMPDKSTGVAKNVLWVTKPVGLVGEGWEEGSTDSESLNPPSPGQIQAPSLLDTPSERSDRKLELLDERGEEGDDEAELERPRKRSSPRKELSDTASVMSSHSSRQQSREAKARTALLNDGDKLWTRMSKSRLPPIDGLSVMPLESMMRTSSPAHFTDSAPSPLPPNVTEEVEPMQEPVDESIVQAALQTVTCKICDKDVFALVFEKHHGACVNLHRADDTIGTVNEELRESNRRLEEICSQLQREIDDELEDMRLGGLDDWSPVQHRAFLDYLRTLLKVCDSLKGVIGDTLAIPTPESEFDASSEEEPQTPPRVEGDIFSFSPLAKSENAFPEMTISQEYQACPPNASVSKRIKSLKGFVPPSETMFRIPNILVGLFQSKDSQETILALQDAGKSVMDMSRAVRALVDTKVENVEVMQSFIVEMGHLWNEEESLRMGFNDLASDAVFANVIPPSSDEEFMDAASELASNHEQIVHSETEPLKDHDAEPADSKGRRRSIASEATSKSSSSSNSPVRVGPAIRAPRVRTLSETDSRVEAKRRESRLRNAIQASDSSDEDLWGLIESKEVRDSNDSETSSRRAKNLLRAAPLAQDSARESGRDNSPAPPGWTTEEEKSDVTSVTSRLRALSQVNALIRTKEMTPVARTTSGTLPGSPSMSSLRSQPSMEDFEVIKPISKGAYGSVYLAKKKQTGDYYALKILRKSDMVQKNQVSNVRNERMILTQLDSPFVVKLFYSFQSKDSLYLVMEYLNGGDVAALIKAMGQLDEKWAKQYVAEVILGLEFLHARGIVHRDLKPDNLLIDSNGHLKLTDFGLSRVGFLGRRRMGLERLTERRTSMPQSPMEPDTPSSGEHTVSTTTPPLHLPNTTYSPFVAIPHLRHHGRRASMASTVSNLSDITGVSSRFSTAGSLPKANQVGLEEPEPFAGTPDYLAPESILGLGQDVSVDWWALGVITFEFLFGFPPFHAETPNQVFENILARRLEWPEDVSPEAKDFMERLMTTNVETRLGSRGGAAEVKQHKWLQDVDWPTLLKAEVSFVPKPTHVEDTLYFDDRGVKELKRSFEEPFKTLDRPKESADFGRFAFKNLSLLEKQNEGIMEKIRSDLSAITQSASALDLSSPFLPLPEKPGRRRRTVTSSAIPLTGHRQGDTLGLGRAAVSLDRVPEQFEEVEVKQDHHRTTSVPVVLGQFGQRKKPLKPSILKRRYDVLVVEDNPITAKIMETMLTKLGCRSVIVNNGAEAVRCANGDVRFDVIFMDLRLPIMDGDDAARMIKSVVNVNQSTPLIAVTAFEVDKESSEFDDVLSKPVTMDTLIRVFKAYFEDGVGLHEEVIPDRPKVDFGSLEYVPIATQLDAK
jgi:serine/threonine protein kinase/CheY-like chemotaxis protein